MNNNMTIKREIPSDYLDGEYKLDWVKRGAKYIEKMLVPTIVAEFGNGPVTRLGKQSIGDLYTESGLARIEDDQDKSTEAIKSVVKSLRDQVIEALCISSDYEIVKASFYDTIRSYYIADSVKDEEQLTDDSSFERSVQFYMLIRVIRHVAVTHEDQIARAIRDASPDAEGN